MDIEKTNTEEQKALAFLVFEMEQRRLKDHIQSPPPPPQNHKNRRRGLDLFVRIPWVSHIIGHYFLFWHNKPKMAGVLAFARRSLLLVLEENLHKIH